MHLFYNSKGYRLFVISNFREDFANPCKLYIQDQQQLDFFFQHGTCDAKVYADLLRNELVMRE